MITSTQEKRDNDTIKGVPSMLFSLTKPLHPKAYVYMFRANREIDFDVSNNFVMFCIAKPIVTIIFFKVPDILN